MSLPIQELMLGERYEDGSGWQWAAKLHKADSNGQRRVSVGTAVSNREPPSDLYLAADRALLRRVAQALNQIADALDPNP